MNIRNKSCCCSANKENSTNIYSFEVGAQGGKTLQLSDLKGKVLLIVNTASKCGFTPQYTDLQALYAKYNGKGLEILDFPCNQFGKQESGSSDEIEEFCQINYGVTFPLFQKIDVNGKDAHPIFKFLKSKQSGGIFGSGIKWNFTKFVIDRQGVPVKRFSPTTKPEKMEKTIQQLL